MEGTSLPEIMDTRQQDIEQDGITLEQLDGHAEVYRNQLILPLKALPWERRVMHVEGEQAKRLFEFCADSENLDLIPEAESNIYSGIAVSEDSQLVLDALNSAITNGIKKQIEPGELAVRKRLLAWVDHLDQILAAKTKDGQTEGGTLSPGQHAA